MVFKFNDPERKARREEKAKAREAKYAQRQEEKAKLKEWRREHQAEEAMNRAATMRLWPSSVKGMTAFGPVLGGRAELFNADAHKAWTATRLVAGAATGGMSAALTGRKNKGAAAINITFGNGNVQSFKVVPEALSQANSYVTAFNALADQLAKEAENG